MAISENILLARLSGALGKQLVIKQYGDKTVVCKYPDKSRRKPSARQIQNRQLMDDANAAAKTILADEEMRNAAQVRLNVTRNKLYTSLVREYFLTMKAAAAPVVESIPKSMARRSRK